jgi:hypothetical protein
MKSVFNPIFEVSLIFDQSRALIQDRRNLSPKKIDAAEDPHQAALDDAYDRFIEAEKDLLLKIGREFLEGEKNSISAKDITPAMIGELICAAWTGSQCRSDWLKEVIDKVCLEEAQK